ncbi:TIGR03943 family protein [Actinocorallia lasiicapitis]
MTRAAQNLLMILLGGALLWITLATGEFTNYVKPGLRLPLVASAVVLVVLGLSGLRRDWHSTAADSCATDGHGHEDGHGHGHGRQGPRVAWLLCLPVIGIFAVAPPELGAFTASRASTVREAPQPAAASGALPASDTPVRISVGEFIGRSFEMQIGGDTSLRGRQVRLLGFVTPRHGGGWFLTRLQVGCCAADAIALQVSVVGADAPPKNSWVEVTGTWKAPPAAEEGFGVHYITAVSVTPAAKPSLPYE